MTDGVCEEEEEEVTEGFGWTAEAGGGVWGGGRWYTLVPVSPLIKSSLKEPESEHTHIYTIRTHTDIFGSAFI